MELRKARRGFTALFALRLLFSHSHLFLFYYIFRVSSRRSILTCKLLFDALLVWIFVRRNGIVAPMHGKTTPYILYLAKLIVILFNSSAKFTFKIPPKKNKLSSPSKSKNLNNYFYRNLYKQVLYMSIFLHVKFYTYKFFILSLKERKNSLFYCVLFFN